MVVGEIPHREENLHLLCYIFLFIKIFQSGLKKDNKMTELFFFYSNRPIEKMKNFCVSPKNLDHFFNFKNYIFN